MFFDWDITITAYFDNIIITGKDKG